MSASTPVAETLSPEQRVVAESRARDLVVTACAGSGKTRALVGRIVWLLRSRGIPANSVLALGFTRAAAHEIRERVREALGDAMAALVDACTIHSFALRILRVSCSDIGLPKRFRVADEDEEEDVLLSLFHGPGKRSEAVRVGIEAVRQAMMLHASVPMSGVSATPQHGALRLFYARLADRGLICYAQVLPLAFRALQISREAFKATRRYRHVLVDEAQDCTPLEVAIIRWLDAPERTWIGDDAQRIFGWRGSAGFGAIRLRQDQDVMTLDRSYRCREAVASMANEIGVGPPIVPAPGPSSSGCSQADDGLRGAVASLLARHEPAGIAVLCRTNAVADDAAALLGSAAFRVTRHANHAIRLGVAALRVAHDDGDNSAARILLHPKVGRQAVEEMLARGGAHRSLWSQAVAEGVVPVDAAPMDVAGPDARAALEEALGSPDVPSVALLDPEAALDAVTDLQDADGFAGARAAGRIAVATIHAAKGKEWPAVVLVDFPHRDDEDRRVRYVAVTRASQDVVVVAAPTRRRCHAGGPARPAQQEDGA